MEKYLTEFIGTFFLVLTITLVVITGQPLAPLAIGSALMVMVFMGGHISGAHYNPAVSLAALIRGALPSSDLIPYWISQLLGGTAAALLGNYLVGGSVPIAPGEGVTILQALLAGIIWTFALVLVILNVATAKGTAGNSFYGLAIGFTVFAAAVAAGDVSGGAFNPAVGIALSIGAALAGTGGGWWWLYIVGPVLGGVLGAYVFSLQGNEDIELEGSPVEGN